MNEQTLLEAPTIVGGEQRHALLHSTLRHDVSELGCTTERGTVRQERAFWLRKSEAYFIHGASAMTPLRLFGDGVNVHQGGGERAQRPAPAAAAARSTTRRSPAERHMPTLAQ